MATSTSVVETQNVTTDAQANVTINGVESTFSITVPKNIVGTGESGSLDYTVEVEGDIAGNKRVFAIPDEKVSLKQDKKADIDANITQDKTSWVADELDVVGNGEITYSDLSAGTWQGNFNFNVGIETDSYIPVSVVDSNGEDLNASASLIIGEKADELLAKLVESGNITSTDQVDLLVDIQTDSFEDISTATFDVSSIASEGEKIAILHYNHNGEWELVAIETVSAEGTVGGNFANYSPVAFVKVTEEGNLGDAIVKQLEAGLYDVDNNLLAPLTAEQVQADYTNTSNLASSLGIDSDSVYKAILPEGTTLIGNYAFYGCSNLASFTTPDSVTSIGKYAFKSCTSLTSVSIPDLVTSIGVYAFWNCTSLTSVTIPDSVTSINVGAFCNCSSLTSITIPDSVTTIDGAFCDCSSLTSITIPDSVTLIGNNAFYGCNSLTSVTIPDSVTTIGNSAFRGCSSLTSITIPDSVTSIGNFAFSGCSGLTSITIPDSVTEIGMYAFSSCTNLTSITIPDSVTEINHDTFRDCTSLSSVTIPNSVTSIGSSAFEDCTSLPSVTIPDSVTTIGSSAFWCCISLTSVTIPDSVTSIGNKAFYRVPHITYNGTATGSPWGANSIN